MENVENNNSAAASDLMKLTAKQLKERCKEQGLKCSGNKTELVDRFLHPDAARAKRAKTSSGLSKQQVHQALLAKGYANPERASSCAKRAIQRGHLVLDGDDALTKVVYSGHCQNCNESVRCTMQDLLDQPDYGGMDYEDGGESGAVQCQDCGQGMYLTRLCEGRLELDSGKFHNHCTECPGFGRCIGDYREAHCQRCNKHYTAGNSGFECDCRNRRRRGGGRGGGGDTFPASLLPFLLLSRAIHGGFYDSDDDSEDDY